MERLEIIARVAAGVQIQGQAFEDTRSMLVHQDLDLLSVERACELLGVRMGDKSLSLGLIRDVSENTISHDWDRW